MTHIAFASAHPYLPQIAGGSQSNTHEMARKLIAQHHRVSVLAGLTPTGSLGWKARLRIKLGDRVPVDRGLGYPVYRAWHAWNAMPTFLAKAQPDVVIVQSGQIVRLASAVAAAGVPLIQYLHNIEYDDHGGDMLPFAAGHFLANSQFTARRYREDFGIEAPVIVPLFEADRYRVASSRERILFVNPHPSKGVDLALDVAQGLPEIGFDFVESWTLSPKDRQRLTARLAILPNVTLHPRSSDMRPHYARARLVLVPSRWEETWGRVASEAHYSGIPVVATRIGGLVEAVGPGGVLLDPAASAAAWIDAIAALWRDVDRYESLSAAAITYAGRRELDSDHQLETLHAAIARATA